MATGLVDIVMLRHSLMSISAHPCFKSPKSQFDVKVPVVPAASCFEGLRCLPWLRAGHQKSRAYEKRRRTFFDFFVCFPYLFQLQGFHCSWVCQEMELLLPQGKFRKPSMLRNRVPRPVWSGSNRQHGGSGEVLNPVHRFRCSRAVRLLHRGIVL